LVRPAGRFWLVPAIAAGGFLLVFLSGSNQSLFLELNRLGPATSDIFWANVTLIGDATVGFALCLVLWRRRPELLWAAAFVALLGAAWVHGFKPLFDVPRPPAVLGDAAHVIGRAYKAHSFPSGHATTVFAIGGLLFLGTRSGALRAAILVLAIAASVSRSVVGVHWPLDILAGAFGGWLAAVLGLFISGKTARLGLQPAVQWTLALLTGACAVALVLGHPDDYPDAVRLERLIGLACLAAAAMAWGRDARLGHAGLGRRPDL
jgi:membrane-associated phospholipid phosphatase